MSKWVWLASIAMMSSSVGAAVPDTSRIVDEGMNRSRIMLNAHELLDGIGPRLTISTNMRRAQDWAAAKFTGYGLTNVHREGIRIRPRLGPDRFQRASERSAFDAIDRHPRSPGRRRPTA